MSSMFDYSYPAISSNIIKDYDWFDFYRDLDEAIPHNMPQSRKHKVSISMFVDADLAGDKSTSHS